MHQVLAAIVFVDQLALRRHRERERCADAPRARIVRAVHAGLSDLFGRAGEVEEVVLDLEVHAKRKRIERELGWDRRWLPVRSSVCVVRNDAGWGEERWRVGVVHERRERDTEVERLVV